jgi:hypothetical protein
VLITEQLWARGHYLLNDSIGSAGQQSATMGGDSSAAECAVCHVPYSDTALPFPISLFDCATCGYVLLFYCQNHFFYCQNFTIDREENCGLVLKEK